MEILFRYGGQANIVTLFDVFDDGTYVYMVMELLKGGELLDSVTAIRCERSCFADYLSSSLGSEREAMHIMRKLAEAVDYLHAHGVQLLLDVPDTR